MSNAAILRIVSRGSPLALAQARLAREALARAHGWDAASIDAICPIVAMKTTGDRIQDRPLAEAGGKGLFTKEIEEALLASTADIAVHSMKDVPAVLPAGLEIAAVLPRADHRDVFLARDGGPFSLLKPGARVGTSSVRRQAQVLRARRDLNIVLSRGNVGTRLAKLEAGEADAIILARAGLERLGNERTFEILDGANWLPALCQGAIGIEIRTNDTTARTLVNAIDDEVSHMAIACERGFLGALDGSCRTPIAGFARVESNRMVFRGEVLTPDGRQWWTAERTTTLPASRADTAVIGKDAAREIREAAGINLPVS